MAGADFVAGCTIPPPGATSLVVPFELVGIVKFFEIFLDEVGVFVGVFSFPRVAVRIATADAAAMTAPEAPMAIFEPTLGFFAADVDFFKGGFALAFTVADVPALAAATFFAAFCPTFDFGCGRADELPLLAGFEAFAGRFGLFFEEDFPFFIFAIGTM